MKLCLIDSHPRGFVYFSCCFYHFSFALLQMIEICFHSSHTCLTYNSSTVNVMNMATKQTDVALQMLG